MFSSSEMSLLLNSNTMILGKILLTELFSRIGEFDEDEDLIE